MTSQPDLLSAYVQAAYQKISIQDLFGNAEVLHKALSNGMPQFKWEVTSTASTGSVHISATLANVKESWTISLSLTKGRAVSRDLNANYDGSRYARDSYSRQDRPSKPLGPLDPDPHK